MPIYSIKASTQYTDTLKQMCWKNSKAEICTDLKGIKSDGTTLWKICQTQAKREWMSECACNVRKYKTETCRQTDTERDTEKHNDKDTESKQIFATNHLDPHPRHPNTHTHKFHTKYTIKLMNEYQRQANLSHFFNIFFPFASDFAPAALSDTPFINRQPDSSQQ